MDADKFNSIMLRIAGETQEKVDKSLENLSFSDITFLLGFFNCDITNIVKAVCKFKGVKYDYSRNKSVGVSSGKNQSQ